MTDLKFSIAQLNRLGSLKMYYTRNSALLVCLVSILFVSVSGQTKTANAENSQCKSQQTCTDCIRTPNCVWCSEKRDTSSQEGVAPKPRCMDDGFLGTKTGTSWCPRNMIVNPKPGTETIRDTEFSSVEGHQVQIKPQHVKMVLRRGQAKTLKIRYKQASNYPVDLYFLMDLSATMEDHKNNLSKLGRKLKDAMNSITSDFQIGFGSFVDKVMLPMTSIQPGWIENKCHLKDLRKKCAPSYGYKHQMSLSDKYDEFQENVDAAPISANLDAPEGGLDAIMQSIVCGDKIGWRKNARHIIVYSTDATYHIAGDGRLAGLIEPNDETCHLNSDGFYTHAEILDYPSVSQVNKQAQRNNINIIFAVTNSKEIQSTYKDLSEYINGSSLGVLDERSEGVVDLVRREYEKLTRTITMTSNASKPIELKYFTRCLNADERAPLQDRNDCDQVRPNTILEFDVTIEFSECPERMEDWHQTIEIKPQGVNERVIVDVDLICDCPCSRPDHENYESSSTMCSRSGDLICGVCACKDGYYGKKCNCKGANDEQQSESSDEPCRDKDNKVCSGHGSCICGLCKCDTRPNKEEKISGEFCECDNFSCKRYEGMVCGGPSRGKCECGTCVCNPGLQGESCGCRISNSTCFPKVENATQCSGFGECHCGSCRCTTEGRSGEFCEVCPTCPTQRCDELKDCVECYAYETGPKYTEKERCSSCQNIDVDLVDDIDESPKAIHPEGTHVCKVPDSSGCTFVFTYKSSGRGDTEFATVEAEKSKKCPEPTVNALGVAGGAIALTLFLGLLGLITWKVLTMVHDHREWVKFEKERISAKWEASQNPLFKEPTTSFNNPTFGVKG